MNTKNILSVVVSLVSALTLTSCVVDVPVPGYGGGHGPIHQQGGPPPGYQGGGFNPGYNQGYNTGPFIYHGDQRRHVYGSGPQSYAQWGQPPMIRYNGGF